MSHRDVCQRRDCPHERWEHVKGTGFCTAPDCGCTRFLGMSDTDNPLAAVSRCLNCHHTLAHHICTGPCDSPGCDCRSYKWPPVAGDPSAGLIKTDAEGALRLVPAGQDVTVSYDGSERRDWPRDFVVSTLNAAEGIWLTGRPGLGLLCRFDQKWLWVGTKS